MSEGFTLHPGADELLALISGELPQAREKAVREHLAACAECTLALERVEEAWAAYREYHRERLKPSIPAAPKPWASAEELLKPGERTRRKLLPWVAAAAVLLAAIQVYQLLRRPPVVSAAELLRKATASEQKRPRTGRIRIRTGRHSLVRPALAGSAVTGRDAAFESELQARFAGAHYSWADPLGAGSFSQWRDQLPEKHDEVSEVDGNLYRIRTSTSSGPLVEATLSLRAADLHPVESELKFRDQTVEITELPESEPALPEPLPPAPPAPRSEPAPAAMGPADELRAFAALHEIGADLGEPVEVTRREHEVVVNTSGLTPERERELRQALAAVPGAVVRSEDMRPASRRPYAAAPARTPNDELANQVLEASDAALARAFALDTLASRFPPQVEAALTAADRSLLAGLRRDHLQALGTAAERLDALLKAAWPEAAGAPPAAEPAGSRQLLESARHLDQLLNRAFAGPADVPHADVLATLRQLQARAAGARP